MLVAKLQALKEVPLPAITSVQAVEGKVEKTSSKGLEDSPKSQNTHSLSSPKEEPATSTNRSRRTRRSLSSIDLHEEKREERSAFMPLGTPVRGMTRSRNGAVDTVVPEVTVTVSSTAPSSQPYVQQNGNITQIHAYGGEETTITVSATDNSGQISGLRLNGSPLYGLQQQPLTGKGSKEDPDYSWADFRKNLKSAQVYYIVGNQKPHMIAKGDFDPTTWQVKLKHPLFRKLTSLGYFGRKRPLLELGEDWINAGWTGYDNEQKEYTFFLTVDPENKDEYILYLPYLWVDEENGGKFDYVEIGEESTTGDKPSSQPGLTFAITNKSYGELPVQKTWYKDIPAEKQPESVRFYLLYRGKRGQTGLDEKGQPVYRYLDLKKTDQWQGKFDKLDPKEVVAGNYSVEEASGQYELVLPEKASSGKVQFRIHYANEYDEGDVIDGMPTMTSTTGHFKAYFGPVDIKLYIEEQKAPIEVKQMTWKDLDFGTGMIYHDFNSEVVFGQDEKKLIQLDTHGQPLLIDTYAKFGFEPGQTSYNFYIKKNPQGIYTFYKPLLFIKGKPYDMFEVTGLQKDEHGFYDKLETIPVEGTSATLVIENRSTVSIHVEKKWEGGSTVDKPTVTIVLKRKIGFDKDYATDKRLLLQTTGK